MTDINWKEQATKNIKDLLEKQGVDFIELEKRLKKIGIKETHTNLSNKINRGTFNYQFVLQLCESLNVTTLTVLPIKYKQSENSNLLSKKAFVDKYMELNKIFTSNKSDFETSYYKVEDILEILLRKIGICEELIKDSANYDCDVFIGSKTLKMKNVEEYYESLISENKSLNELESFRQSLLD